MKYGNVNLGRIEALINKIGGEDAIARVLSGEWIVGEPAKMKVKARSGVSTKVLTSLLELTGEPIKMSAVERFVVRDKFLVNRNGELPVSYLGDNFRNNFLDVVEENVPSCTLKQHKLLKASVDAPILSALGDKDLEKIEKARSALAHVFVYLKTANRTKWYLFYVADSKGIVWAVRADWRDGGWDLYASSVANSRGWDAGRHVVSP